jgi:fused signal recognition particle receptor
MFKFLKEKIKDWAKNVAEDFEATTSSKDAKPSTKAGETKKPKKIKVKAPEKEETKGIFQKIGQKINFVKISEEQFDTYAEELENLLLENNVALEVAERIIRELKNKIMGKEIMKKEIEEEIREAFKEIIKGILVEPFDILERIKAKKKDPYVILFCGVNGSGKTTTIAKIADWLKRKGVSCVIAASDTFRAASIEQIKEHGEKIGVKVISNDYGVDPASVAFDAINYAKKNFVQCVLIDTAGRMHTAKNLIREIEKIAKVTKPDLKIFIGESITGNDAVEQIKSFNEAIGIDGIVLTKADIDEKGGTALSLGYVTKKPILYLGTGQDYDAIEPFNKKNFIIKLGL